MRKVKKSAAAVVAGLVFAASLGSPFVQANLGQSASLVNVAYAEEVSTQTDPVAQDPAVLVDAPNISMIEEHQYSYTLPVENMTKDELTQAIADGKVSATLSRNAADFWFSTDTYPNQKTGGALTDWMSRKTPNWWSSAGTGVGAKGTYSTPQPIFDNITYEAEEDVDGVKLKVTFNNHLFFDNVDGIDVRARAMVRSSMYDYVGAYKLGATIEGNDTATVTSTDVTIRPYDEFRTQPEVDAELNQLAAEANKNGQYAEVVEFGTSAKGRPMRALFVAKSKADLDNYKALTDRMENDPSGLIKEVEAGSLNYKVPVVYSNVHADEINAVDAVMEFAKTLVKNEPMDYKTVSSLTDEGKSELATEMELDRTVWSDLIKDKVQGIGYIRGNGGQGTGKNYDMADINNASSDLSDEDFAKYYNTETKTFDPSKLLDDMFFILIPSENVDARTDNVRTNGNGFDLNRDNTYQTQPETQAMAKLISTWNPLTLHEVHGFYQQFQVEPCSPTHDPNNEYDLFIDTAVEQGEAFIAGAISNNETANSIQMPIRDYLKKQDDGSKFWEAPFDDMSTSYTPQYAMMHGTNAYTVEAAYGDVDCLKALKYGFIANADFVKANKNRMFTNQLKRFERGIKNEDADSIRKYYVNQADVEGAEADKFRPRDNENKNFFPEYYVIPMDEKNQEARPEAAETIQLLLNNDVKLKKLDADFKLGDKTYPAGTVVVDMHQAKRNMANCVLYPNLVIDDWTLYSLYSEPLTNFSELRGFNMDTIRTPKAFEAAKLSELTTAPETKSFVDGKGRHAIIKNNCQDSIKAVNELLKAGNEVRLITEGENAGSYIMDAEPLKKSGVLDNYTLDVVLSDEAPKAAKINKDIKVYVPQGNTDFVLDADSNPTGMKGYNKRLDTNNNWDYFALDQQLGFTLTDNLDEADIIVGSAYPANADEVAAKIKAGTPYVAYTPDAMSFIKDQELAPGMEFTPDEWIGTDALSHVSFPTDNIITATYKNEGDDVMYGYSGGTISKMPDGATELIRITNEDPIEAFMPREMIEEYKGSLQAFDYQVKDGVNMAVFANTLTNKTHQQDDYRYLSAAIYSKLLGEETPGTIDEGTQTDPSDNEDNGTQTDPTTDDQGTQIDNNGQAELPKPEANPGQDAAKGGKKAASKRALPKTSDIVLPAAAVGIVGVISTIAAAFARKKKN